MILVTGGAGFCGQNIVPALAKKHEVLATYRHTRPESYEGVEYVQADVSDEMALRSIFDAYDINAVVHLAMQMKGARVSDYLRNSMLATERLIEEAERAGVQTFVLASSIAIYGHVDGMVDEQSDRTNLDDYATSKYVCERLLEDSTIESRIALRLPRILGEGMDLSYPWIPALIGKLIRGDEVNYFNPELPYNNMAHVSTLSEFICLLLESPKEGYTVCTLGASEPLSVLEVIERLHSGLQSTSRLKERTDHIPRNTCYAIDISRACALGYKPLTASDTLDLVIQDMCKQQ